MRTVALIACVLLAGSISERLRADDTPNLGDEKVIAEGRQIFLSKQCAHCHGEDGTGGVNLADRGLNDPKYVFQAISEGREKNGIRMPAWGEVLSDKEIWEATAYVLSISHKPN